MLDVSKVLMAGWGKVDFTPAELVPLAGYTHVRERLPATVRDPVQVRVLALREGDKGVILLAYDLLMVIEDLYQGLRSRLADTGFEVVVTATHTHSSIGGFWNFWLARRFLGQFRPWIMSHLISAGERAAREALATMEQAEASAGSVLVPGLNGNRRDPTGPTDEELTVLHLKRQNDSAVLFSYSAHPVIVAERDHQAMSADFPGVAMDRLDRRFGFSMYIQGALGGVDVLFPKDPQMTADRNLEMMAIPLANAVETIVPRLESVGYGLQVGGEDWDLGRPDSRPYYDDETSRARFDLPLRLLFNLLVRGVPRKVRVRGFALGSFVLLGFQADLGVGIALSMKEHARKVGFKHPLAASQTDGYIGYLHLKEEYRFAPPPAFEGMGRYENAMNFFGRETGDAVLDASRRVLSAWAETKPSTLSQ